MTQTKGLLPEGYRDRLPPQAEAAAVILRAVLDSIAGHGYGRVAPPLAEFEEELVGRLKSAKSKDLLRFVDSVSMRTLALRPDITAQISRIATTRLCTAPRPLRLSYGGPVLKLKATQLRPERELTQAGAELIGTDSLPAAIEIILVAIEALEAAGVTGITLDLTMPDLVTHLGASTLALPLERVEAVQAILDAKDAAALCAQGAAAYLPLIEAAGPLDKAMARLRAAPFANALTARLSAIETIAQAVGSRAIITLDPTERHGFEYQTWLGFSLFGEGLSGEAGRGGSYTIVHSGDHEEAAVGFSLFLDPLVDAGLGQRDPRRVFMPQGSDSRIAAKLRSEGWATIAALSPVEDGALLNCTHILKNGRPQPLKD